MANRGLGVERVGAALGVGEAGSSPPDDPPPLKAAAVAIDPPRTSAPTSAHDAVRPTRTGER